MSQGARYEGDSRFLTHIFALYFSFTSDKKLKEIRLS